MLLHLQMLLHLVRLVPRAMALVLLVMVLVLSMALVLPSRRSLRWA